LKSRGTAEAEPFSRDMLDKMLDVAAIGISETYKKAKRYPRRNMTAFEVLSVTEPEYQKIVFASKNRGKIKELKALLKGMNVKLLSLHDYPDIPNIIEDGNTFLENALKKARVISEYTGGTIIADDSGLEVDYLKGDPGIHSARYSRGRSDG